MALGAHGIALLTPELRGVNHAQHGRIPDVLASGSVAAFARYAAFEEGRIGIAILCSIDRLDTACMATQARGVERPVESHFRFVLISRRSVPFAALLIPGNWQLEQIAFPGEEIAAAFRVRSDEVVERRVSLIEVETVVRDAVSLTGSSELCGVDSFDVSARSRHGSPGVIGRDFGMAIGAGCAAHKR